MTGLQPQWIWIRSTIARYVAAFSVLGLLTGVGAILLTILSPKLTLSSWVYFLVWSLFLTALLGLLVLLSRLTGAAKDAREASFDFNSELYGFAYESLRVAGTISRDGSMTIKRDTVAKAYTTPISKIDHWLLAPEAESGVGKIELEHFEVRQPRLIDVDEKVIQQLHDRMFLVLDFDPPIAVGKGLRYRLAEQVPPGSMALTRDELVSRGMDYEFIAWDITRPTRSFKLSVTFPDDLLPAAIEHDVWYGVSRMKNLIERDRVASSWSERQTESGREYSFQIPYPVLGLTYVIRWIPPDSTGAADSRATDDTEPNPS